MYSLCARFFAIPAVEVGARRASPPSTFPRVYTYENLPQAPAREEVKKLFISVNGTARGDLPPILTPLRSSYQAQTENGVRSDSR
jgi:hypothetical protein